MNIHVKLFSERKEMQTFYDETIFIYKIYYDISLPMMLYHKSCVYIYNIFSYFILCFLLFISLSPSHLLSFYDTQPNVFVVFAFFLSYSFSYSFQSVAKINEKWYEKEARKIMHCRLENSWVDWMTLAPFSWLTLYL